MAAFFVVVGRSRHCRVFLLPFYPCLGPFTSHGVNFSIPLVFLSPNGITNSTTAYNRVGINIRNVQVSRKSLNSAGDNRLWPFKKKIIYC